VGAALVVGVLAGGSALALSGGGEETQQLAGPDPTSLGFTFERTDEDVVTDHVSLDQGRIVLVSSAPQGCPVVPDAIRRTPQGDLRIAFVQLTEPCDGQHIATRVAITLDSGPVPSGTTVLRDDEQTGVLLVPADTPLASLPVLAAGERDCGTVAAAPEAGKLACLVDSAAAGTPARLDLSRQGAFTGYAARYEVYGREQVRVTSFSSSDCCAAQPTSPWRVWLCARVTATGTGLSSTPC
jgi:hypothetical protein